MDATEEPARGNYAKVPSADLAAERWARGIIKGQLEHLLGLVQNLGRDFARLSDNVDHLHADVTALREVQSIPRPECYPDIERRQGARRRRKTPRAEEPPAAPAQ